MKQVRGRVIATLMLGLVGAVATAIPAYADGLNIRVEAAPAHGKVGDTIPVYLKVINPGPGGLNVGELTMRYIAAGGTELADDFSTLPYCHVVTAGHEAWCSNPVQLWPLDPAVTEPFPIHLKIVSAKVTPGQFKIECARCTSPANNSAAIVVTVDGVTPAPTAPAPAATTKPSPKSSVAAAAPTLPVTGADIGLIGSIGAALLAVGITLFLAAKRRTAAATWIRDR
jgi:hypothetical protein